MYEKRNSSVRLELRYYTVYILISAVKRGICDRITGIHATCQEIQGEGDRTW